MPAPEEPAAGGEAGAGPGAPPSDAIVLFDGTDLSKWEKEKGGGPAAWTVADGAMVVKPKTGGIRTKQGFGDVQLHIEWATPSPARGSGQDRGNSGVFFQSTYEVQVLDSFENETYWHGSAGSVYKQYAPLVNASRKPGEWQVYDIVYHAPAFNADGRVTKQRHVHGVLQRRSRPGSRGGDGRHDERGPAVLQGARGQAAAVPAGPRSHGAVSQYLGARTVGLAQRDSG